MTPTDEQMKLARQCAAKYWQTGEASDEATARRILSGEWDDQAYTQAALAAIQATTEAAAKLAEDVGSDYGMDETGWFDCTETVALQLRRGDHLKGHPHG